jgi:hypothetical protein
LGDCEAVIAVRAVVSVVLAMRAISQGRGVRLDGEDDDDGDGGGIEGFGLRRPLWKKASYQI